jgi:hypothetical protein
LNPPRTRSPIALFRRLRWAAIGTLALAALSAPARAADAEPLPEDGEIHPDRMYTLVEAGSAFAIGSKLGSLPQLAAFKDLPGGWQAGAQARFAIGSAHVGYDYLPLASVSLRKLWVGDEESVPIRNAEYFGIALGAYPAYDFDGARAGMRPLGALALGKYWMPFESHPFGLDLNLDLMTLKLPLLPSGHLSGHAEQVVVSCAVNLFYAFR